MAGIAAAVELGRGGLLAAALLVQLKTLLDNADGQLARLTGRTSAFGRYLDSEVDLLVNAALFAGLGWTTGSPALALAGFLAVTSVLSLNFNVERLSREAAAEPEFTTCSIPPGFRVNVGRVLNSERRSANLRLATGTGVCGHGDGDPFMG